MMKEEALIKAMIEAITAPSDTESEQATKLGLEIARNMSLGEVLQCQRKAIDIISKLTEQPSKTLH